jgi:transcription elongation factor Elf1
MRNIITKPVTKDKEITCPYCGGRQHIVTLKTDGKAEELKCGYCKDGKIITKEGGQHGLRGKTNFVY